MGVLWNGNSLRIEPGGRRVLVAGMAGAFGADGFRLEQGGREVLMDVRPERRRGDPLRLCRVEVAEQVGRPGTPVLAGIGRQPVPQVRRRAGIQGGVLAEMVPKP